MGRIRTGTVGFSYRDWMGIFYSPQMPARRQLAHYLEHFDACELTQFTHQMPDPERIAHLASQLKTDVRLFVRVHNTLTHCADAGMALTMARHFRKAMEPLFEAGKLGGFVAPFPYAFKDTAERRDYIQELASVLSFEGLPLQLDFRHTSWTSEEALEWMRSCELALVCVDEPELPGLVPALAVATSSRVLIRLHGRNAGSWWSGNATTRHDYSYSNDELRDLVARYRTLIPQAQEISFLFQNHWQAQSVQNALTWKHLVQEATIDVVPESVIIPALALSTMSADDDSIRPPATISLAEAKMRVSREFSSLQAALDLPPREEG